MQSREKIRVIVERVAEVRAVDAVKMLNGTREIERIASARSMAMAACVAVNVPLCHVARVFKRQWATVYQAEAIACRRYRNSANYRREWDLVTKGMYGSGTVDS